VDSRETPKTRCPSFIHPFRARAHFNCRKLPLAVLLFVHALLLLPNTRLEGQEKKEETQRTLTLSTLESKGSPHFEFTLPSGNISEQIEQQFNNLHLVFDLRFNFLDSSIGAEVGFFYPVGFFTPGVHFFQSVDLENLIAPKLQGGELTLLPAEKFVSRDRGIGLDFIFNVTPIFTITPAFLMNDTFKGSFTEDLILDEGIDWIAKLSFVLDSGKPLPVGGPEPRHSAVFSSVFSTRFRNVLTNPVSIDHGNELRTNHYLGDRGVLQPRGLQYDAGLLVRFHPCFPLSLEQGRSGRQCLSERPDQT